MPSYEQADLGAGLCVSNSNTASQNHRMAGHDETQQQQQQQQQQQHQTQDIEGPLPKCFCNWKKCREYQKALRKFKHPLFSGVIKLKFQAQDVRSMAFKDAVDRVLQVDESKKEDWKPTDGGSGPDDLTCRYYVARHHFTEELMKDYLADRRAWDWTQPLTPKQAKAYLWSLDPEDIYMSEDEEEDSSQEERYVQVPNVPREQVKEIVRRSQEDYRRAQQTGVSPLPQQHPTPAFQGRPEQSAPNPKVPTQKQVAPLESPIKVNPAKTDEIYNAAGSIHTQSTLSTTVTDQLKAFEGILGSQDGDAVSAAIAPEALAVQNIQLQQELNKCHEQLANLMTMVSKLQVGLNVEMSRDTDTPTTATTTTTMTTDTKKKSKHMQPQQPKARARNKSKKMSDSSSEEDSEEQESSGEEDENLSSSRQKGGRRNTSSDDDETISTFHISQGNSGHGRKSTRKSSVHSRRNSIHSRRNSVHSRSRHSVRRDSIHSRRSVRGGAMDDAASVVSKQSLQSVSPSIKSLPREIELMDEDEEDTQGKDDFSFFGDSYRGGDDDARSVGSRSAASRASRRSMVSGARSRGRNSRVVRPAMAGRPAGPAVGRGGGPRGSLVPKEIDVSGDELEDETYANVSTDTLFVNDRQIVDPYGEKGVYTGALSRSTGMPNGKGRLEYEKEGRWYEGDWIHGRWTGYGRLSNGDGDFYEGELENDHKHGTGIMRFADGRVFEGEYIRGQMIQGKMTYQDGSVYGGSWVDGMRDGKGRCIFADGSDYEGEFREGNFHGYGQMTWNDGGWYVGEWCDGEMHGRGKEIRPDGSLRHDGEWSRGQPIRSANDSRRRKQQPK